MDIGSIPDKIASNADKIGMLVGSFGTFNSLGRTWGMDTMNAAAETFMAIIRDPHFPNLAHVWELALNQGIVKTGAIAAVAGYFLKEVDMLPMLNKLGNALMKAGIGAAEANIIIDLLVGAGAMHSPFSVRSGGGHSSGWGR